MYHECPKHDPDHVQPAGFTPTHASRGEPKSRMMFFSLISPKRMLYAICNNVYVCPKAIVLCGIAQHTRCNIHIALFSSASSCGSGRILRSPLFTFFFSHLCEGRIERSAWLTTHASPPNANSRETPFHTPPTPSYELESCAHMRVKLRIHLLTTIFTSTYLQCIED